MSDDRSRDLEAPEPETPDEAVSPKEKLGDAGDLPRALGEDA